VVVDQIEINRFKRINERFRVPYVTFTTEILILRRTTRETSLSTFRGEVFSFSEIRPVFLYDFSDVFKKKKNVQQFSFFYPLRTDNARSHYLVRHVSCEKNRHTSHFVGDLFFRSLSRSLSLVVSTKPTVLFFRKPHAFDTTVSHDIIVFRLPT